MLKGIATPKIVNELRAKGEITAEQGIKFSDSGDKITSNTNKTAWTPTVSCASPGTLSITYNRQNGFYWETEDRVFVEFDIDFSFTLGSASGFLQLNGLPIIVASDGVIRRFPMGTHSYVTLGSGYTTMVANFQGSSGQINFRANGSGVIEKIINITDLVTSQNVRLVGRGWYFK